MGPKNSVPQGKAQEESFKINHSIFALAHTIKGKQEQLLIKTQVRLPNINEYKTWVKKVDQIQSNDSLMTPIAKQYKQQGLCGSSGMAVITYQNFPYLLSDEIINRQNLQKKLFQQNQLWYLVYTLLSAANVYHQKGLKVGDIRPDNIFINQDGQVKVASVDSWPGQQTNYSKSFYQKQITYLSPQEIKDYQFGKMQESGDKVLAQTFSIGLTCLDAATLSESKSLYSKNFKFSYQKLQAKLKQFKDCGYSQLLVLTIQNMCQVDTEFRSSSRQILKWLMPHEQAIVNLQEFQVNGLPEKIKLARQRGIVNGSTNAINLTNNVAPVHLNSFNYTPTTTYTPSSNINFNRDINIAQQQSIPTISTPSVNIPSYLLPSSSSYQGTGTTSYQGSSTYQPTFTYQPTSSNYQSSNTAYHQIHQSHIQSTHNNNVSYQPSTYISPPLTTFQYQPSVISNNLQVNQVNSMINGSNILSPSNINVQAPITTNVLSTKNVTTTTSNGITFNSSNSYQNIPQQQSSLHNINLPNQQINVNNNNNNSNEHLSMLQKIDAQLQQSRKMFPSA